MINVKVKAKPGEPNISIMRRFSRRVQQSGIIRKVRKIRYQNRVESDYKKKSAALRKIEKVSQIQRDIKLGKIMPKKRY